LEKKRTAFERRRAEGFLEPSVLFKVTLFFKQNMQISIYRINRKKIEKKIIKRPLPQRCEAVQQGGHL
jgi:hypothetical protein